MAERNWLTEIFGSIADGVADGIADARAKLVDEGWFGRRVPEHNGASDLGWFLDHPGVAELPAHQDHAPAPHEHDRGIDL